MGQRQHLVSFGRRLAGTPKLPPTKRVAPRRVTRLVGRQPADTDLTSGSYIHLKEPLLPLYR